MKPQERDNAGVVPHEEDQVKIKQHNIGADQFEDYVFFIHSINGCVVTFSEDVMVEFKMTQADASLSVGSWGGEGLAKVPKKDKKTIKAIMDHPLYKVRREIRRIPSPDEIMYKNGQIDGREFIKRTLELIEAGIQPPIDFDKLTLQPLQVLANKCGISAFSLDPDTFAKEGEKTKAVLVKELKAAFNQENSK